MKLTDLFIKRPVLAIVVNLVILIAGLQSIRSLSVRQYPRSDIAVVTVTTAYVGANANLVRGFITTPLERVIASADGIDYMESSSAQGVSTITVHLTLNYDTNAALTQIQAKVAQVRNDLPPEAEAPVIDLQTADNQFAAMYLGFSSRDLDQNQITDYLTRVVQPKLSAISGVQRADPRNRKMTTITMRSVSVSVRNTSRIAFWMYSVESYGTPTFMPTGSCAWISLTASRTRPMTSSELAVGSTQTPMKVEFWPLKRTSES